MSHCCPPAQIAALATLLPPPSAATTTSLPPLDIKKFNFNHNLWAHLDFECDGECPYPFHAGLSVNIHFPSWLRRPSDGRPWAGVDLENAPVFWTHYCVSGGNLEYPRAHPRSILEPRGDHPAAIQGPGLSEPGEWRPSDTQILLCDE
ncbi:hypothetical protein K438DRAFT_1775307 [Mycena galopus ATCC 62051]|nr:hypothetical protein K438DRAFT_1775307 [Mycena galopus ATCC 62051]